MASAPPTIFSDARRLTRRRRMLAAGRSAQFMLDDMVDDVIERLAFVRHEPKRALVLGDYRLALGNYLEAADAQVTRADIAGYFDHLSLDLAAPYPHPLADFDFIAALGLLDTVNDLPGALIHIRNALAPGGLVIASFAGAGSLPVLRQIMLEADGERPAARIHPLVDIRAAAQLLQRAGWADPVVDSHTLKVRYTSLDRLIGDLRAQGLGNVLARPGPALGKAGLKRARAAFDARREDDGKVTESFEIITLSGRRKA